MQYFSVNKFGVSGLSDATTIPTVYGGMEVWLGGGGCGFLVVVHRHVGRWHGFGDGRCG